MAMRWTCFPQSAAGDNPTAGQSEACRTSSRAQWEAHLFETLIALSCSNRQTPPVLEHHRLVKRGNSCGTGLRLPEPTLLSIRANHLYEFAPSLRKDPPAPRRALSYASVVFSHHRRKKTPTGHI
jgi:hypothetical protein